MHSNGVGDDVGMKKVDNFVDLIRIFFEYYLFVSLSRRRRRRPRNGNGRRGGRGSRRSG